MFTNYTGKLGVTQSLRMSGKHDFENPGERISAQINGNGGGKWFGITQQGWYAPSFVNDNSPEEKHMLIEGTTESVSFYPFHCQHLTLAFRSQCDFSMRHS